MYQELFELPREVISTMWDVNVSNYKDELEGKMMSEMKRKKRRKG